MGLVSSINLTADVNTVYNVYRCRQRDFSTAMAIVHVGTAMNVDSVPLCYGGEGVAVVQGKSCAAAQCRRP